MNYEFHPEAEQELYESALQYESEVPGLGLLFCDEVSRAIELLVEYPELGSLVDRELRHLVLRNFPFSLVYAAMPDLIFIVAIAHGHREPGYWRLRVQDR
jgi:hypothetical protein